MGQARGRKPGSVVRRQSKYGAVPTVVDNIRFHSAKEARRYSELKLLEKAGEITGLLLQPRYGLWIKPFVGTGSSERVSAGNYVGDFQYYERSGELVVEDVKGVKTPAYRLKKRIVEALYGFQITET